MFLESWIVKSIFSTELIDFRHEQRKELDVFGKRNRVIGTNLAKILGALLSGQSAPSVKEFSLCHALDLMDELHPLRPFPDPRFVFPRWLDLFVMLLRPGDRARFQFRTLVDLPRVAATAQSIPLMLALFRVTDGAIGRMS
jgi:hypothetical protein